MIVATPSTEIERPTPADTVPFDAGQAAALVARAPAVDAVGLEERAAALAKRSIKKGSKLWALDLAVRCVDLTTLEGADTPGKVVAMCAKAVRPDPTDPSIPAVAAVCIYPALVSVAAGQLRGTGVHVASVAGSFPSGLGPLDARLAELARRFAIDALVELEGDDEQRAAERVARSFASGEAAERFARMVESQGGDPRVVEDPWSVLPRAPARVPLPAPGAGWLAAVDTEAIGMAGVALGAGRVRKGDPIDPAVGMLIRPKVGDRLRAGEPIGEVHARSADDAGMAVERIHGALTLSDEEVAPLPLVYGWHDGSATMG